MGLFDREYWDLYWDVITVNDLAKELPKEAGPNDTGNSGKTSPSVHALIALRVANAVCNVLDAHDRKTWPKARELLDTILRPTSASAGGQSKPDAVPATPTTPTVFAIGHCHIDTAWLWPYAETRRKTARSWSSQLKYMGEPQYKNYKFTASQAQQLYVSCRLPLCTCTHVHPPTSDLSVVAVVRGWSTIIRRCSNEFSSQ